MEDLTSSAFCQSVGKCETHTPNKLDLDLAGTASVDDNQVEPINFNS